MIFDWFGGDSIGGIFVRNYLKHFIFSNLELIIYLHRFIIIVVSRMLTGLPLLYKYIFSRLTKTTVCRYSNH